MPPWTNWLLCALSKGSWNPCCRSLLFFMMKLELVMPGNSINEWTLPVNKIISRSFLGGKNSLRRNEYEWLQGQAGDRARPARPGGGGRQGWGDESGQQGLLRGCLCSPPAGVWAQGHPDFQVFQKRLNMWIFAWNLLAAKFKIRPRVT